MKHRFWTIVVLVTSLFFILVTFSINVFIDPANIFGHSHRLNKWKYSFDERLQKTSYLTHRIDIEAIDTLFLGSSRNTYYNPDYFDSLNVFNYAFSNGNPEEYVTFLDYAKSLKNEDFSTIFIGLDFIGYGLEDKNKASNDLLITNIQGNLFWTKYFSLDMLVNSAKTVVSSLYGSIGTRVYNDDNKTYLRRVDPDTAMSVAQNRAARYYLNMVFDEDYFKALRTIKENNQNSKIIVFTNPVSIPFLTSIYSDPVNKAAYFNWIDEIVKIYGNLYFFTYPNKFAHAYKTLSKDGDHYYEETLLIISDIIQGKVDIAPYGIQLNEMNFDEKMLVVEQLIEALPKKKLGIIR